VPKPTGFARAVPQDDRVEFLVIHRDLPRIPSRRRFRVLRFSCQPENALPEGNRHPVPCGQKGIQFRLDFFDEAGFLRSNQQGTGPEDTNAASSRGPAAGCFIYQKSRALALRKGDGFCLATVQDGEEISANVAYRNRLQPTLPGGRGECHCSWEFAAQVEFGCYGFRNGDFPE